MLILQFLCVQISAQSNGEERIKAPSKGKRLPEDTNDENFQKEKRWQKWAEISVVVGCGGKKAEGKALYPGTYFRN